MFECRILVPTTAGLTQRVVKGLFELASETRHLGWYSRSRGTAAGFQINVIRLRRPIKGTNHSICELWLTSLEKLFRRRAMGLRALHMRFDARDLGLEGLDTLLQFLDRHRVEVLPAKLYERVAGLAREKVFEVHGRNR